MVFLLFSLNFLSVVAVSVTQVIPLKGINPRRTTEFSEVIMYFSFCFYFHKLSRQLQQGQNYVFNRAAGMWDLKNIPQSSHEPSQLFVWRAWQLPWFAPARLRPNVRRAPRLMPPQPRGTEPPAPAGTGPWADGARDVTRWSVTARRARLPLDASDSDWLAGGSLTGGDWLANSGAGSDWPAGNGGLSPRRRWGEGRHAGPFAAASPPAAPRGARRGRGRCGDSVGTVWGAFHSVTGFGGEMPVTPGVPRAEVARPRRGGGTCEGNCAWFSGFSD